MITNENTSREAYVTEVAKAMMAAARTAPKAKGTDRLEIITVGGDDLYVLARQMRLYAEISGLDFFNRDAANTENASAAVIIGTRTGVMALDCGYCGFESCAAKSAFPLVPCAFNTNDMGIAVGSAVSLAADHRIDSRVMYSVGRSAMDLGWLPGCKNALGILLSCTAKSPFFDRVTAK